MPSVSTPSADGQAPVHEPSTRLEPAVWLAYQLCKSLLLVVSPQIWRMAWDNLTSTQRRFAQRLRLQEQVAYQKTVGDTLLEIEAREQHYRAKFRNVASQPLMAEATKLAQAELARQLRQRYLQATSP